MALYKCVCIVTNGYEGIHGGYAHGVCNEEGNGNRFLEMAL